MFWIKANQKTYGPFGDYENALRFARANWKECKFYIVGSEIETLFTHGLDPLL
jgi:hypothetical protein